MSYGTNTPFGLKPVQTIGGTPWDGGANQTFYIPSGTTFSNGVAGLFFNDPVVLAADGGIDSLQNATDAQAIVGSFQGCSYIGTDGVPVSSPYLLTGQLTNGGLIEVYVAARDDILFEVQIATSGSNTDATTATFFKTTDVNNNALLSQAAGTYIALSNAPQVPFNLVGTIPAANATASPSRSFGLSAFYLSSATRATGQGTYNVKIVQLTDNLNNNIYSNTQGNIIFNTALVLINNHPYKGGTGTVGV